MALTAVLRSVRRATLLKNAPSSVRDRCRVLAAIRRARPARDVFRHRLRCRTFFPALLLRGREADVGREVPFGGNRPRSVPISAATVAAVPNLIPEAPSYRTP